MAEITELKGLEIKLLPIKLLVNNEGQIEGVPKNPRFIKDWRYKLLLQSLTESPEMLSLKELWVYKVGNIYVVIAGNMRLRGSKEKGYKSLPCKILPPETTIEKLKEYAIKDNSGYGDWEMDSLANEWESPKIVEWGVELHGWENGEVPFEESETVEAKEDDFDTTPPTVAKTVLGDLYEIGLHRVLCGDATCSDTVARLMGGGKADLVFTDPPYNIDYQGVTKGNHEKIANDKMSDKDFTKFLYDALNINCDTFYVCCSWQYSHLFRKALEDLQKPVKAFIVWDKINPAQHLDKYFKQHEIILYHGKFGGQETLRGDVWQTKRQKNTLHPTMKPIELIEMALNDNPDKKTILDPFLGSGSTMVAAHQLRRKCYGMELEPKYCDVIVKRMLNLDSTLRVKRNGVDVTEEWRA